jgi:hypothetical protein
MKDLNETVLAKGIYYNKKTDLCIFEVNEGELKWFNVHLDNIEGKFYQGCPAILYKEDEVLKADILNSEKKKKKFN